MTSEAAIKKPSFATPEGDDWIDGLTSLVTEGGVEIAIAPAESPLRHRRGPSTMEVLLTMWVEDEFIWLSREEVQAIIEELQRHLETEKKHD